MQAGDRKGRRSILWALKLSAAAVVLALLVLGILSVVLNDSQKAQECPFCREANCVEIRSWWKCEDSTTLQATASACQFAQNQNGTSTVTCPTVSPSPQRSPLKACLPQLPSELAHDSFSRIDSVVSGMIRSSKFATENPSKDPQNTTKLPLLKHRCAYTFVHGISQRQQRLSPVSHGCSAASSTQAGQTCLHSGRLTKVCQRHKRGSICPAPFTAVCLPIL